MDRLKIILVDDNISFRQGLKTMLIHEFNCEVIGEASNAEELRGLMFYSKADIILMDIMMPGTDGIQLTKELLLEFHNLKIIAITSHVERVYLISLIMAGFRGCIFKRNIFPCLQEALTTVHSGQMYFPNEMLN
jgi:DNA-binding NarL/FixJ family response regulator